MQGFLIYEKDDNYTVKVTTRIHENYEIHYMSQLFPRFLYHVVMISTIVNALILMIIRKNDMITQRPQWDVHVIILYGFHLKLL